MTSSPKHDVYILKNKEEHQIIENWFILCNYQMYPLINRVKFSYRWNIHQMSWAWNFNFFSSSIFVWIGHKDLSKRQKTSYQGTFPEWFLHECTENISKNEKDYIKFVAI